MGRSIPALSEQSPAPQVPVLRVLLAADLKGVQYFTTLEEAGGCGGVPGEWIGTALGPHPAGSAQRAEPREMGGRGGHSVQQCRARAVRTHVVGGPLALEFHFLGVCVSLAEIRLTCSEMHRS